MWQIDASRYVFVTYRRACSVPLMAFTHPERRTQPSRMVIPREKLEDGSCRARIAQLCAGWIQMYVAFKSSVCFDRTVSKTRALFALPSSRRRSSACFAGLLFVGVKYGLVPQDPMLLLVLLIESCMPSAQNAVIMLQVRKVPDVGISAPLPAGVHRPVFRAIFFRLPERSCHVHKAHARLHADPPPAIHPPWAVVGL